MQNLTQCLKDAKQVFLKPSPSKQQFLSELTLCVVQKALQGQFELTVESLVSQLVKKEGDAFLIAQVFFDYNALEDSN